MAVSFEATMAEQVAGYVRPGSQVALFVTYRIVQQSKVKSVGRGNGNDPEGTSVLLPKVEVIAVGTYGGDGETTVTPQDEEVRENTNGGRQTVVLVTVAASDVEAAKIIHAAEGNALYLALLSDSSQVRPDAGVDSYNFLK
jgi:pilus assembly protein CpaB